MAVTGIRFPDEMSDISTLALDDKVLVADESDSKKAKWFKIEELSQFLTLTNTVGIKSTVDNFVLTAEQSISETITLTLRNAIAENSFVMVVTENGFGGAIDSKKVSYTAGQQEVTIQNDMYFQFEDGDEIAVYYFYGIGNEIPAELPITLDSFSSIAGISNVQYSFTLSNPNDFDINAHVNLCFDGGTIQEVIIKVTANSSKTYTKTYNSLSAGTHTLVLSGDVTGTETAIISVPLAAAYTYSNFRILQNNKDVTVFVDITNTGDLSGMAGCYFQLNAGTLIHKGLNPISVGQKLTFQHLFTNLSSGTHTFYGYEDNGTSLIDSETITIPVSVQPASLIPVTGWDVTASKMLSYGSWYPYTLRFYPENNRDYAGYNLHPSDSYVREGRSLLKYDTTGVTDCVTAKIKILVKQSDYTAWDKTYFKLYESIATDPENFYEVWNNHNAVQLLLGISTETDANYPGYYIVNFTLNSTGIALINSGTPVKFLLLDENGLNGVCITKYTVDLSPVRYFPPQLILTY